MSYGSSVVPTLNIWVVLFKDHAFVFDKLSNFTLKLPIIFNRVPHWPIMIFILCIWINDKWGWLWYELERFFHYKWILNQVLQKPTIWYRNGARSSAQSFQSSLQISPILVPITSGRNNQILLIWNLDRWWRCDHYMRIYNRSLPLVILWVLSLILGFNDNFPNFSRNRHWIIPSHSINF